MGSSLCGCSNSSLHFSSTETNSVYINYLILLQFTSNRKNKENIPSLNLGNNKRYDKETYNSLSQIDKITIKNNINKIISAYKVYIKKKNVSKYKNIIF